MSDTALLVSPLVILLAVLAAICIARASGWLSTMNAARILTGIPLLIVAIANIGIAVMLAKNGHAVGALFVQTPTLITLLAFAGTIRPNYEWVAVQVLVCLLLLLASFVFLMTAGIYILMINMFIFAGMLFTASAAARRHRRNDAYWQHYFSRNA